MDRTRASLIFIFLVLCSLAAWAEPKLCLQEKKLPSMGSFFELQLTVPCSEQAPTSVFVQVQKSLDALESELSLYQSESGIQKLNRAGTLSVVSEDFRKLIELSQVAGEKTDGAFDITILPVLLFIQNHFKTTEAEPKAKDLDQFQPVVNYKHVQLSKTGISFQRPGVKITLDGVAKGYAVDQIAELLEQKGHSNYLLNFSGNMRWLGRPPDKKSWAISRWNSVLEKAEPLTVQGSGAIASSGAEHNHYSAKKRWHHLLNPKTLRPANIWAGTTVLGPSATQCDILSTALFTMPEAQIRLILSKNFSNYRAWVTRADGSSQLIVP